MGIRNFFCKNKALKKDSHTKIVPGSASKSLAECFHSMGENSISTDLKDTYDIEKEFAAWADHILSGKPVNPNHETLGERKDWRGASSFFSKHRKSEVNYIKKTFEELRKFIWEVLAAISKNFSSELKSDTAILQQLGRLKFSSLHGSHESLKAEAIQTVQVITKINASKRQHWREELKELGKKLKSLRSELDSAKEELQTDALTRLYNRGAVDQHIERVCDISLFSGKPASLAMLDIDHFKKINDEKGHQAGDAALFQISRILIDCFPRKTDFVARYGGEEFVVIFQEDGLATAKKLVEKLRQRIEAHSFTFNGECFKITVSLGIAELNLNERSVNWLGRADRALYKAKKTGRNKIISDECAE